jgi:hypothetical protein
MGIDDHVRAIALIKAGWLCQGIAAEFDCSWPVISRIAAKYDLKFSQYKKEFSYRQEQEIVRDYLDGESLESLFSKNKTGTENIKRVLEKYEIPLRDNKISEEKKNEVQYLYEETDLDITNIEKQTKVGYTSILKLAKKRGWARKIWKRKFFKDVWAFDLTKEEVEKKLNEVRKKQSENSSGENNPMYGKPTPNGAGNGWKGRYKGRYFRSLQEASFMIEKDDAGIAFENGETMTIPYEFMGRKRTYRPDFIIGDTVYELKPKKLMKSAVILAKKEAAEKYLADKGMKYVLMEQKYDFNKIKVAVALKHIILAADYMDRLLYRIFTEGGMLVDTTYETFKKARESRRNEK